MPPEGATSSANASSAAGAPPLSELLAGIELSGLTWCYVDLAEDGGFSVPHGDAVLFHAVLHGTVRLALPGGGAREIGAGEAVAVMAGDAHALRVAAGNEAAPLDYLRREQSGDAPASFALGARPVTARVLSGRLALALPPSGSRSALPDLLNLGDAAGSAWGALIKPEALALAGIGPGSSALLTRLAATMIVAQLRADPGCRQLFSPEQTDPIGQALRLISSNPSANWTVERLARSVGMGRSNFAAHFTTQVGRAPMEVVAEQRMEHAAQLLRKSKLKIAEISELSGYGSEAAFSRRFTRSFGVSPSQLREQARTEETAQAAEQARVLLLGGPRVKPRQGEKCSPVRSAGRQFAGPERSIIFPARRD